MQNKKDKLYSLVVQAFEEHVNSISGYLNEEGAFEKLAQEGVELKIGQVIDMGIYSLLLEIYLDCLDKTVPQDNEH